MTNKIFDSKYEVIPKADSKKEGIGQGGQGTTYLVLNKKDNKIYALKSIGNNKQKLERLKREYQNLLTLNKDENKPSNIPCVYDCNFNGKEYYFVMEYIDGVTIEHLSIERDFDSILQGVFTLISAIRYCHHKEIIHRDIKPQNIIARNKDIRNLVLLDFGISYDSQNNDDLTQVDENVGNKFCLLPENRKGDYKRKPQTDIIQCVAMLFYLLTGIEPNIMSTAVDGIKPHDRIEAIINLQWIGSQRLRHLNEIFDRGFDPLISNRFQTCDDLLFALNRLNKMECTRFKPYGQPPSYCLETFLREFQIVWNEEIEIFTTNYKHKDSLLVIRKTAKYDNQKFKMPLGYVDIEKRENYLVAKNKTLWLDAISRDSRNLYYDDLDILFPQKMEVEQYNNLECRHWELYADFTLANNIIHFSNLEIRKNEIVLNVYKPFVQNIVVPIDDKIIYAEYNQDGFVALSENGTLFKFNKDAEIKQQMQIIDLKDNMYDEAYAEPMQSGIFKIKIGYVIKCFKKEVIFVANVDGETLKNRADTSKVRTDRGDAYPVGSYNIICNKEILAPKPNCLFIGFSSDEFYKITHFIDYEKVVNSIVPSDEESIFLLLNSDGSVNIINVVNGAMFGY